MERSQSTCRSAADAGSWSGRKSALNSRVGSICSSSPPEGEVMGLPRKILAEEGTHGYVAVTGGQEAIEASVELLREYRSVGECPVELEAIRNRMGLLIDRIMSEAGLYAPEYAALH